MKAKALNLLITLRTLLLCTLVIGMVLELIIRLLTPDIFSGEKILKMTHIWGIYNYSLAPLALFIIFGFIFLPKNKIKDNSIIPAEKPKKTRKRRKELLINFLRRYITLREFFFLIGGVLCMLYLIISLLKGIGKSDISSEIVFGICIIAIMPVYAAIYYLLPVIFPKLKKDDDYNFKGGDDIGMYLMGLFLPIVGFIILGSAFLIITLGGRGIHWLSQYPLVAFGIIISVMYILTRKKTNTSKK